MEIAFPASMFVLGLFIGLALVFGPPNLKAWAERLWFHGPASRKRAAIHILDPDIITHATCFDDDSATIFLTEGGKVRLHDVDVIKLKRGMSEGAIFTIETNK